MKQLLLILLLLAPAFTSADDKKPGIVAASAGAAATIIDLSQQAAIGSRHDTVYTYGGTRTDTITSTKRIYILHFD